MTADNEYLRDQFRQIHELLEGFRAEVRSLTASINSNATNYERRFTSLEREQEAIRREQGMREEAVNQRTSYVDGQIAELAKRLGEDVGAVENEQAAIFAALKTYDAAGQQAIGVGKVWKLGVSLAGAALIGLNLWHMIRH